MTNADPLGRWSSRKRAVARAEVQILAELLQSLDFDEVGPCVGFLSGIPRQGRVGIGYSAIFGVEVQPAREPSLTVGDVDRAIDDIQAATGSGSATRRRQRLA